MLMKNWTLDKYNPDYFWDFEDATIENMTSDGSVSDPAFTKINTPYRFDISQQYYGMWASDNAVFSNGTGVLRSTNSTLGSYLDNGDYCYNFFWTVNKDGFNGTKNLIEINFQNNSLVLQLLGTNQGADTYKLRVLSGGTTLLTSTEGHWSYATSGTVNSGGFLSTPLGWNSNKPNFMMISIRQNSGTLELLINGSVDVSASYTAPSGTFTDFRIGSQSLTLNYLIDQLSIAPSSIYTSTNLTTMWNLFLEGKLPVDPMTTSSALFADPSVVITSPDVTYAADSMDASSDFINPFPEIAEINPADILEASALMNDSTVYIDNVVSVNAALASIESGNHLYSWYHVRRFNRRDKIPSGTDAIYNIVNVFGSQNLWFYQAQIQDISRITSSTSLYFKPELSGIASGSVVKALIKLPIYNFSGTSGTSILDMYRTTGAWSLDTIINSNQPAATLVTNDYSFSWTSGDFHYIDVTELYNNLASNSNTGFYISLSSGNNVYFDLESFPNQFELELYLNTPPINATILADSATATAELSFGSVNYNAQKLEATADFSNPTLLVEDNVTVMADAMLLSINATFNNPQIRITYGYIAPTENYILNSIRATVEIPEDQLPYYIADDLPYVWLRFNETATPLTTPDNQYGNAFPISGGFRATLDTTFDWDSNSEIRRDVGGFIYNPEFPTGIEQSVSYSTRSPGYGALRLYGFGNFVQITTRANTSNESWDLDFLYVSSQTGNTTNVWVKVNNLVENSNVTIFQYGVYSTASPTPGLLGDYNRLYINTTPGSNFGKVYYEEKRGSTTTTMAFSTTSINDYEWHLISLRDQGKNSYGSPSPSSSNQYYKLYVDGVAEYTSGSNSGFDNIDPQATGRRPRINFGPVDGSDIAISEFSVIGAYQFLNENAEYQFGIWTDQNILDYYKSFKSAGRPSDTRYPIDSSYYRPYQGQLFEDKFEATGIINDVTLILDSNLFVDPMLVTSAIMNERYVEQVEIIANEMIASALFEEPLVNRALVLADAATANAYMYYLPLVPLDFGTASGVSRYTNVYHRVLYSLNSHTVNHVDQETDSYWLTVPDTSEGNITYIQQRTPAGSTIRQPIYLHWFSFAKSNANYAGFINLGVGGSVFAGDQAGSLAQKIPIKMGNISYRGDTDYIQYPNSGFATKPYKYEDTGPGNTWQFKFDGESYLRIPESGQSNYGSYLQNYMTGSYYGSYEMTIRTDQNNCVLGSVSQSIKATVDGTDILGSVHSRPSSKDSIYVQAEINSIRTENPYTNYTDRYHDRTLEYAYLDEGDYINYASSDQGRNYGDIRIVDGKIAFYHKDRLSGVETLVLGTTLINDLNNHHIIVNRTVDGFGNMNQADKNKKSRLELWVDGNLEAISYEINDKIWLNRFSFLGTGWSLEKSGNAENGEVVTFRPRFDEDKIFTGYMQDYICRSNRPLTEIEIQRLARARFEIIAKKTDPIIASSSMPNATVTTNAKTILRLYWDINETRQNGLSFTNNNYNIYTYNVLKTTYNKPSELFNLDQNFKNKLQELEEVSAITNDYVYLSDPSVFLIDPGNVANQFALGSELVTTTRPRKYHQEFLVDGVIINTGDRFAVTGQTDPRQNGLYIYNGRGKPALRTTDSNSASKLTNCYFYVRNGNNNSNTYWTCVSENITKRTEAGFGNLRGKNSPLIFKQIYDTDITESSPIYNDYYRNGIAKTPRFIDVNNDIEFDYDIITFINYPTNSNELLESIPGYDKQYVSNLYKDFINNLIIAAANGKNIFVNSPMLTEDLGIARNIANVPQTFDTNDTKSQSENLFDLTTSGSIHFDNYRNNKYRIVNTLSGLTNQATYIMTDFINYIPEQSWLNDQYHIKYTSRLNGLYTSDEYIIPTLPLRSTQLNLIKSDNQIGLKDMFGVLNSDILVGTPIASFAQNYWVNNVSTANPYQNYVTTIAVNSGSVVKGTTITGKIFVNLVEDGLTAGREDYNYAILQDVPNTQETVAKRLWQYSTSRLRKNKKYVLEEEAYNIQRLPSNSGGGPIVQMSTNITNGTIRNNYDIENGNAYSTEYNNVENELYTTIKVPCLSMSYMGLKWLGG